MRKKIIGITAATNYDINKLKGQNVNVIFAESKEALPDDVPDLTLGVVPSAGGGGDTSELAKTVESHTTQIGMIAKEINTINFAIGEANERVENIERDHDTNTGFVMAVGGLAENPENEGKVLGIKDETIVAMDAPSGGGLPVVELSTFLTPEGGMFSDEDNTALNNANINDSPFIAKFTIEFYNTEGYEAQDDYKSLLNYCGGNYMAIVAVGNVANMLVLFNQDGTWGYGFVPFAIGGA